MSTSFPFRTVDRGVRRSVGHVVAAAGTVALSVAPHGGQRAARRNALGAILDNEVAARARHQAQTDTDRAIAATLARRTSLPAGARAV